MRLCARRNAYVDGSLSGQPLADFEQHLPGCASCRSVLDEWHQVETLLGRWEETLPESPATESQAQRLAEQAFRGRSDRMPSTRWRGRLALAAGVTAVVVLGLTLMLRRPGKQPLRYGLPTQVRVFKRGAGVTDGVSAPTDLLAPDQSSLLARVGAHRMALAARGRMKLLRASVDGVEVRLYRGTAAFQVRPRHVRFTVWVEAIEIRVVGTRFFVERGPRQTLTVYVARGEVRVRHPVLGTVMVRARQTYRVEAGRVRKGLVKPSDTMRQLEALLGAWNRVGAAQWPEPPASTARSPAPATGADPGAILRASSANNGGAAIRSAADPQGTGMQPATATPRSRAAFKKWRRWLAKGRYPALETALVRHLRRHRTDGKAWSLLGDCRRKAGRTLKAVQAYRAVIRHRHAAQSGRARFMAASLLQGLGKHRAAVKLLDDYLRSAAGGPLEAEARLRLARSLLRLGQRARGVRILRWLIQHRRATGSAIQAQKILQRLKKDRKDRAPKDN